MNFKYVCFAALFCAGALPAAANQPVETNTSAMNQSTTVINSTTIGAAAVLSPGRYVSNILPNFNPAMSRRLEAALRQIPGVSKVKASSEDSVIRYTIASGSTVRDADVQKAISQADAGAVASTPLLEKSMSVKPGL